MSPKSFGPVGPTSQLAKRRVTGPLLGAAAAWVAGAVVGVGAGVGAVLAAVVAVGAAELAAGAVVGAAAGAVVAAGALVGADGDCAAQATLKSEPIKVKTRNERRVTPLALPGLSTRRSTDLGV